MRRRDALALIAGALACSKSAKEELRIVGIDDVKQWLADDKAAGKVAVAHFWATWCGPCIEEFPALARMYKRIANESRIDFFAIAVAERDPVEVQDFVKRNGATFPVFIADADDADVFTDAIDPRWGGVLPATFTYAKDGKLAIRNLGAIEDTREFESRLRELARS